MKSEEEPFLPSSNERILFPTYRKLHVNRVTIAVAALTQLVLIAMYALIAIIVINTQAMKIQNSAYGMRDIQIKYVQKAFTAFQDSPFTGTPNAESDEAWESLLSSMTIRVSEAELQKGNQSSVALPDGGYMAWLGVYHELHCVKYLRQWKYRDYYFPVLSSKQESHKALHAGKIPECIGIFINTDAHLDHCIEMLRSSALCRADLSLTTFKWELDNQTKPMLDLKRPLHVCVDWGLLEASVRHRVVSGEEGSRIKNPRLGLSSL